MSESKRVPVRTCVGCRQAVDKKELVRIVRDKEGNVCVDLTNRAPGRGAYVCGDLECFKKVRKRHLLDKSFRASISEEKYDEIERILSEVRNDK